MKRRFTESQIEDICSLPEHVDAVIPTDEATFPTSAYTDQKRFDSEFERLLKRVPVPLQPAAILPEANSAFAHSHLGIPILLTRDADGKVHAFLNACRHRGAMLMQPGETKSCKRFVCPYHAWMYDNQGNLLNIPKSEAFPTLDKQERRLRELKSREAGGIIWVGLDPDRDYDFDEPNLVALYEDLDAFSLGDMHAYDCKLYDLKANWKILTETFLETYHVPPVHKNTVAKEFAEVATQVSYIGDHSRQTVGRVHFTRDDVDNLRTLDPLDVRSNVTHAYQVFPTMVVVTSPKHMNIIVMNPRGPDRTIVECHMLSDHAPRNEKEKAFFEKTFIFNMVTIFGEEDFPQAVSVQQGMSSGAMTEIIFGGLERPCSEFNQSIDRYVKDRGN